MIVRKLIAAAALAATALAVGELTACDTKVGQAAVVDGHRISESDVAKYFTSQAEDFPDQDAAGNSTLIVPRVYVLNTLIHERLYAALLAKTPGGSPKPAALTKARAAVLAQSSEADVETQYKQHGYKAALVPVLIRVQTLLQILSDDAQQGVDVQGIVKKIQFPLSINPRYGTWDVKALRLSTAANAGVPGFVRLPAPASASTPAPSAPSPTG